MKVIASNLSLPALPTRQVDTPNIRQPVVLSPRFGSDSAHRGPGLLAQLKDTVFAAKWWIENTFLNSTHRNQPVKDAVFTVFDLETTGLRPDKDALTEIAAIKFKNGREIGKFTTLVKPNVPIPPEIEELTGITNDMVKNTPDPATALRNLSRFVGPNPILVGHYVNFDINFVRKKLDENGMGHLKERFKIDESFCTKTLARKVLPGLPSYSGAKLAKHLGINNPQLHRAEHDTRATGLILFELVRRLKEQAQEPQSVNGLLAYQGPPQKSHGG